MNIDAMNKMADLLEVIEPEAFDMGFWWASVDSNICGTAGCIAGWAVHVDATTKVEAFTWPTNDKEQRVQLLKKYGAPTHYSEGGFPYPSVAAALLELDWTEASRLFESDSWWHEKLLELGLIEEQDDDFDLHYITSKQAAIVVRALVDGDIDFHFEDEDRYAS